ncbi:MAG: hypothetical protein LUD22_00295 [Coprobacillus sp.]|nr:hypothetical protein [Coprobacillus sp.]
MKKGVKLTLLGLLLISVSGCNKEEVICDYPSEYTLLTEDIDDIFEFIFSHDVSNGAISNWNGIDYSLDQTIEEYDFGELNEEWSCLEKYETKAIKTVGTVSAIDNAESSWYDGSISYQYNYYDGVYHYTNYNGYISQSEESPSLSDFTGSIDGVFDLLETWYEEYIFNFVGYNIYDYKGTLEKSNIDSSFRAILNIDVSYYDLELDLGEIGEISYTQIGSMGMTYEYDSDYNLKEITYYADVYERDITFDIVDRETYTIQDLTIAPYNGQISKPSWL